MKACHLVVRLRSGARGTPWRAEHFPPFGRRPQIPDWPAPHNPVIEPREVLFGHENNQFLNRPVDPGSTWASILEPSNLRARSLRFHPRKVSGRRQSLRRLRVPCGPVDPIRVMLMTNIRVLLRQVPGNC